jgi:hypothetical protein
MEKTWKPTVAGILCIIAGAVGAIAVIVVSVMTLFLMADNPEAKLSIDDFIVKVWILGAVTVVTAIVSSIYALRRRVWGLALAGSICALIVFTVPGTLFFRPYGITLVIPGILALVLVIRGKCEFRLSPNSLLWQQSGTLTH